MIKVIIADDHQLIIEGIHSLLEGEKEIEWMGAARTPEDLMILLKRSQPDIVLLDVNLPQRSGLDLCLDIKHLYPGVRVIGLSTSDQLSVIKKMQDNGASGYLLKDAGKQEIMTALREVHKGKVFVSFSVAEVLKKKAQGDQLPALTRREREVLELIAEGLTNQEIAAKLFLTSGTIDSHRKNMLTKFNAKNTAALIKIAVSNHLI
jgi:DNA-binding NarL/FixJ family response regulator